MTTQLTGATAPTDLYQLLEQAAGRSGSLLCVGLDPPAPQSSSPAAAARGVRDWCFKLVDETARYACAFKPNAAFFEALGADGWAALAEVVAHIPPGIPVILDAKRGDIPDTNEMYARSAFDVLGVHAITVSPYLGGQALKPFLTRPDRGVFVLARTSNPGAEEIQGLTTSDREIYEVVAERARGWSAFANVGLVAPATNVDALRRVRAAAPEAWILVPGVGAQGGTLESTVNAGVRADGKGMLINVSRSLAQAPDRAAEAQRLRDGILAAVESPRRERTVRTPLSPLARCLVDAGCVRFGEFTLKSGAKSPIYLDLRNLVSHPQAMKQVAAAYATVIKKLSFQRVAGIPYAALPIATATCLHAGWPLIYPRREAKDYGTKAAIEGEYTSGETVVVLDDLATTGGTKIEAIEKLTAAGLKVRDVVVLIDRAQGAGQMLEAAGYRLHSVLSLPALMDELLHAQAVTPTQYKDVMAFLGAS